jgi:hypothetical protein
MAELFRKNALDTMSTPEQLDKQVKIMRPSVWIIFAAFVVALVTFIIWSFTYKVSDGVNMSGVVFTNNNIINSTAERDCIVTDVLVDNGDYVNIGDIIAVVSNDEVLAKIDDCRAEIAAVGEDSSEYVSLNEQLDTLIDSYVATTVVKSSSSGYVQSVKSTGSALAAGDSIATVMSDKGYNEVVAYVSMQTANTLSLGMTAQVSPSYAAREEYGYMTGIITSISDTPVSEETILAKMGTLSYVDGILPEGSMVEVRIRLDLDDNSANSYKWSNSKGESLPVELGTQCSIIIVTDEYYPVELLVS